MKERSLQFRFLMTVLSAILIITIFIGGLSIYEVDNYIQKETKDHVKLTCENEASKINSTFSNMEKSVRIMGNYVLSFFENAADIEDPAKQNEAIRFVDEMLNYGTEAQKYFKYNADDLANSALTEEQQALATGTVETVANRVKGLNYAGTILSLEDSIQLSAVFDGITNSNIEGMTATVEFVNYRGNTITGDCAVGVYSAKRARVYVNQIVLADATCVVTVKLYKNGTLVGECQDSVESYANRMSTGDTAALNDTIMKFATSAKAYLLK